MDLAVHRKRKREAIQTTNNTLPGTRQVGDRGVPAPGERILWGTRFREGGPRDGYVYYWRKNPGFPGGGYWVEQEDAPGMPKGNYYNGSQKEGMAPDQIEARRVQNLEKQVQDLQNQLRQQQEDNMKTYQEHIKQDKETEKSNKAIAKADAQHATREAIAILAKKIQSVLPYSTKDFSNPDLVLSGIRQTWDQEMEYSSKMNKGAIQLKEELQKDKQAEEELKRQLSKSLEETKKLRELYENEMKKHDADVRTASGTARSQYEKQIQELEKKEKDLQDKIKKLEGSNFGRYILTIWLPKN